MSKVLKVVFCFLLTLSFFLAPVTSTQASEQTLFQDDFTDNNLDGWDIILGKWIATQGLIIGDARTAGVNQYGEIDTGSESWSNYRLEFDIQQDTGIESGVLLRKISNNFYGYKLIFSSFGLVNPETILVKDVNGVATQLDSNNFPLENNQGWYHVKIELNGANIKTWINNQLQIDYTDPLSNIQNGKIGFYYWTGSLGFLFAKYDNIKVTSLDPIPTAPQPFLDLPWDYQSKGLTFNEAATSMSSYFDHTYPLLSEKTLGEPSDSLNQITTYRNENSTTKQYSKHDGYDYAKQAKVNLGDPVLAAAEGCASYTKYLDGNNVIKIDHGNFYETLYLHLKDDQYLITKSTQCVHVTKGQRIGTVSFSGTVSPSGPDGAHIHFGVVEDKNRDGNFNDNYIDGLTDPFGWQSPDPDPWENYTFTLNGNRTGNKSYYLWKNKLDNLNSTLTSNQAVFNVGKTQVTFPQGSTTQNLNVNIDSGPNVQPSNNLSSLGSTIIITAKDSLGNIVTQFLKPFNLTVDFSQFDLTRYNTNTFSIYSSQDGTNWNKENTSVDLNNKTATAQINHLTQFALIGERKDTTPPTTSSQLIGTGQNNWFKTTVTLNLNAQDNQDGLGVDYTLYKINEQDWQQYLTPPNFTEEGHYKIDFYSVDKDENIEQIQSIEFDIDKTPPEAKIKVDLDKLDLVVAGIDTNLLKIEKQDNTNTKKKNDAFYLISDKAGNTLKLDVRDWDKEKADKFRLFSTQYNDNPSQEQPTNQFNISYGGKIDKLNLKEQNFSIKGDVKIRISYNSKKNESTISTKEANTEKVKEIKPGIILLQLVTNKGNLEFSY